MSKANELLKKDMIKSSNLFLNNQMEVVLWENNAYPVRIYCHLRSGGPTVFPHWHRELELTCIFDGKADFYIAGIKNAVTAPGINIVNSEEMHYVLPNKQMFFKDDDVVGITIQIDYSYLQKLIPNLDDIYYEIDSAETEADFIKRMRRICDLYRNKESVDNRFRIQAEVCEIIALLYEKCRKQKYLIPINISKDKERIKIVLDYLNEHYKENLMQQEMAEKFHFTREYFARFFKSQTGMTFKQYIISYRLEKAKEELLRSDKKLLDIALEHGFSSESKFISCFKKHYGQTPLKFRKKFRIEC